MNKINLSLDLLKYIKFSLFLLPFFLITGPFLAEVVIFICCLYYILDSLKKKKINLYNNKFNLGFLIFFISINISSIFSSDFETSILKSLFYLRFFIFFYFINTYLNDEDYKNFNYSIIIAVVFISVDIFIQFAFGKDIFGYAPGMNGLRYQGPFGDEWISGGYLKNFGIIAVTYIFFNYSSYLGKNFSFITILLVLLAIFISGEKMALILFSIFTIFFLFINYKKFIFQIFLFAIFILGILYFINYNSGKNFDFETNKYEKISYRYTKQFLQVIGLSKDSNEFLFDTVHGVHFVTAYEIYKKNKIFGSGIKTFRIACNGIDPKNLEKYGTSEKRAIYNRCTSHPHNFLLEILSETGIIGFFGYLIFLGSIFFSFNWNFNKNSNLKVPYVFSLIFFIFPIATSGSFFNNYNSLILWIILSFIFFREKKNIK